MDYRLPANLKARVLLFGESSMGAYHVALVLRDGTVVDDVFVAWGDEVVKVGGRTDFLLDVSEVVDVIDRT